jgi:putative heme-binding domain-containing protein
MKRMSRWLIVVVPMVLLVGEASWGGSPSWIWVHEKAEGEQTVFFRKTFVLRGRFTAATLIGACDDRMVVFINGKQALENRDWENPSSARVLPLLKRGRNVIAVRASNRSGPAALLLRLAIDAQPNNRVFSTDSSWRAATRAGRGWQNPGYDDSAWAKAKELAPLGQTPRQAVNEKTLAVAANLSIPTATPLSHLRIPKGFRVELLYSVPKETQGSWVSLTVDPKGRLITSDQYGKLYRVTPPAPGTDAATRVEEIPIDLGEAQGLLWAFDSLYVMVNRGSKYASGLYRVRDSDGDDQLDKVELLRPLAGSGEHGPHAVVLGPDGKSLYVLAGNHTDPPTIDRSRVPQVWQEDQLLPRMFDANGHARDRRAPGGWICKIDPEGKEWEMFCIGFRNEYDAAFNRHGDLFTYDSDMEWDMSTPWYRPTRVCHALSGADFGWRTGTGKWPVYYPDSVPPVVNIGPGSPTGMTFGYGAKFPARYQEALYLCDWSYGKLYAVHLKPKGASYSGEAEEFITGTPLPLTDIVINPKDGAMYFTIGGRKATSGLYRVTYVGDEPTTPAKPSNEGAEARAIRARLEQFHGKKDPHAVATAWPYLGHADRILRYSARVAIEHQEVKTWQEKALAEKDPQAALTALVALARVGDSKLQDRVLAALDRLEWAKLSHLQKLELLRAYGLTFARMGKPSDAAAQRLIARLDPHYPARSRELNSELSKMLIYLQAPSAAAKTMKLLGQALTQEEQLDYALALRVLRTGWTHELRKAYLKWFLKAANYRGGHSFVGFVRNIKNEAVENLPAEEREALASIIKAEPAPPLPPGVREPRKFVKKWTMAELVPLVEKGLTRRDFDHGRAMFAAGQCFVCHRFDGEGGAQGPDLTGVAGRFNVRDLLESLLEPSKTISDQYGSVVVTTKDDRVIEGRIINLSGDSLWINTNMLDPDAITRIDRKRVDEIRPSSVSMMPKGLLDTMKKEEILDLFAYLLSRGDRNNKMFK